MKRMSTRKPVGDCLIECAVGGVFLVIIGLFLLNGISVLFCNSINDKVAFNAARAAANNLDENSARAAAQNMIKLQPTRKPLIQDISIDGFRYLPKERVEVTTKMTVGLPAQLPMLPKTISFRARSIETITAESRIKLPGAV